MIKKRNGSALAYDPVFKTESVAGYSAVDGPKFVDSIGWTAVISDEKDDVFDILYHAQKVFYCLFAFTLLLACFIGLRVASGTSNDLSFIMRRLTGGATEISSATQQISAGNQELSEAAVEQSSAIQETAASIDEISAMVKKSAENASASIDISKKSSDVAKKGQESITELQSAITQSSESMQAIMTQVEDGNNRIGEIVKVISEIGSKTKIINDIVFQTKLLSFNASVEAARAGEHGKGFAVVAEEVGNLAQVSGTAAKEISSMLDSSIARVEAIVAETKTKVESQITLGRSRVDSGVQVAKKCGELLNEILSSVENVDGMVSEISSASSEQSQGVSEVNKAMNQLNQVTQKNTRVAKESAQSCVLLHAQIQELRKVIRGFEVIISGAGETPSVEEPKNKETIRSREMATVVSIKQARVMPRSSTNEPVPSKQKAVAQGGLPSRDDPRFEDV